MYSSTLDDSVKDNINKLARNVTTGNRHERTLISNEAMHHARIENLIYFRDVFAELGVKVEIVYYVRNIFGHAWSTYGQMIKRSGYDKDFLQYTKEYHLPFAISIRKFGAVFGKESLTIKSYDLCKSALIVDFFETLGIESRAIQIPNLVVNRSLTEKELHIMRTINCFGLPRRYSPKLSDAIIYGESEPDRQAARITPQAEEILRKRFEADLEYINDFVGIGRFLKFESSDVEISQNVEIELSEGERVLLRLTRELVDIIRASARAL